MPIASKPFESTATLRPGSTFARSATTQNGRGGRACLQPGVHGYARLGAPLHFRAVHRNRPLRGTRPCRWSRGTQRSRRRRNPRLHLSSRQSLSPGAIADSAPYTRRSAADTHPPPPQSAFTRIAAKSPARTNSRPTPRSPPKSSRTNHFPPLFSLRGRSPFARLVQCSLETRAPTLRLTPPAGN
jgi:hypothetical protein